MTQIHFPTGIVKFYPYRTARVIPWTLKVELSESDSRRLSRALREAGYEPDNHICFSTEHANFWYSDNHLYTGGPILEEEY